MKITHDLSRRFKSIKVTRNPLIVKNVSTANVAAVTNVVVYLDTH